MAPRSVATSAGKARMRVAGASPLIAIGAHSAEAYLQCVAPCGMAGTTVACHRSPLASTLQRNSAIPRSRRAPSAMAAPASASPVTTRQLPALEQSAEAVAALAAANPAYAAALATQQVGSKGSRLRCTPCQ